MDPSNSCIVNFKVSISCNVASCQVIILNLPMQKCSHYLYLIKSNQTIKNELYITYLLVCVTHRI